MGDGERAIVSASLNADIPAQYANWFMGRLEAGYCVLPRRDGLSWRRVALTPDAVAGFVFWTRCLGPFMENLEEVRRRGYAFTIQFAITSYPRTHDPSPIASDAAVAEVRRAAQRFGARAVVWRYDPMIVAPSMPIDWHLVNFERLAQALRGATDEVVVAFARPGTGASSSSRQAARSTGAESQARRSFVKRLAAIARASGLRLSVCAEPDALAPGAVPARCIDAKRLADAGGGSDRVPTGGFGRGCLCARAIDIGDRVGTATALFCGALPRRRVWPRRGGDDEMLHPPRRRFALSGGDDMPF